MFFGHGGCWWSKFFFLFIQNSGAWSRGKFGSVQEGLLRKFAQRSSSQGLRINNELEDNRGWIFVEVKYVKLKQPRKSTHSIRNFEASERGAKLIKNKNTTQKKESPKVWEVARSLLMVISKNFPEPISGVWSTKQKLEHAFTTLWMWVRLNHGMWPARRQIATRNAPSSISCRKKYAILQRRSISTRHKLKSGRLIPPPHNAMIMYGCVPSSAVSRSDW